MNIRIKTVLLPAFAFFVFGSMLSSCSKDNSNFDAYFYLSSQPKESSGILFVDGKNYGAINYIPDPVTTKTAGLNHILLHSGKHTVVVKDAGNTPIMSAAIEMTCNSAGTESWGSPGGGSGLSSTDNKNFLVNLFQ
jgi:hypothetical protein